MMSCKTTRYTHNRPRRSFLSLSFLSRHSFSHCQKWQRQTYCVMYPMHKEGRRKAGDTDMSKWKGPCDNSFSHLWFHWQRFSVPPAVLSAQLDPISAMPWEIGEVRRFDLERKGGAILHRTKSLFVNKVVEESNVWAAKSRTVIRYYAMWKEFHDGGIFFQGPLLYFWKQGSYVVCTFDHSAEKKIAPRQLQLWVYDKNDCTDFVSMQFLQYRILKYHDSASLCVASCPQLCIMQHRVWKCLSKAIMNTHTWQSVPQIKFVYAGSLIPAGGSGRSGSCSMRALIQITLQRRLSKNVRNSLFKWDICKRSTGWTRLKICTLCIDVWVPWLHLKKNVLVENMYLEKYIMRHTWEAIQLLQEMNRLHLDIWRLICSLRQWTLIPFWVLIASHILGGEVRVIGFLNHCHVDSTWTHKAKHCSLQVVGHNNRVRYV